MTRHPRIAGCFALALLASSAGARARADDRTPIRLNYGAPRSCPNADAFLAQVAARTPLARLSRGDEAATALSVVVQDVPGGNAGRLALVSPDGTAAVREVSAADCTQVVAALALMTALAIDPNASTAVVTPAPPPQPAAAATAQPPAGGDGTRWIFELGVLGEALGGVAPDPAWVVRPFVQLARESDSRWSLALRLSAARAHAETANSVGKGELTLLSARLEACPARFSAARGFALSACLPVDIGQLEAEGSDLTPSERVARPWLSIGATGRVEWQLLDMLVLEAAGELFFPIVRDRFFVGADATLHRAPALAGGASAGIGVRFP